MELAEREGVGEGGVEDWVGPGVVGEVGVGVNVEEGVSQ